MADEETKDDIEEALLLIEPCDKIENPRNHNLSVHSTIRFAPVDQVHRALSRQKLYLRSRHILIMDGLGTKPERSVPRLVRPGDDGESTNTMDIIGLLLTSDRIFSGDDGALVPSPIDKIHEGKSGSFTLQYDVEDHPLVMANVDNLIRLFHFWLEPWEIGGLQFSFAKTPECPSNRPAETETVDGRSIRLDHTAYSGLKPIGNSNAAMAKEPQSRLANESESRGNDQRDQFEWERDELKDLVDKLERVASESQAEMKGLRQQIASLERGQGNLSEHNNSKTEATQAGGECGQTRTSSTVAMSTPTRGKEEAGEEHPATGNAGMRLVLEKANNASVGSGMIDMSQDSDEETDAGNIETKPASKELPADAKHEKADSGSTTTPPAPIVSTIKTPRFHLPTDDGIKMMVQHGLEMGSILKIDRLYSKEELDKYYIPLYGLDPAIDMFSGTVTPGSTNIDEQEELPSVATLVFCSYFQQAGADVSFPFTGMSKDNNGNYAIHGSDFGLMSAARDDLQEYLRQHLRSESVVVDGVLHDGPDSLSGFGSQDISPLKQLKLDGKFGDNSTRTRRPTDPPESIASPMPFIAPANTDQTADITGKLKAITEESASAEKPTPKGEVKTTGERSADAASSEFTIGTTRARGRSGDGSGRRIIKARKPPVGGAKTDRPNLRNALERARLIQRRAHQSQR